jgi:hypothetical protein
MRRTLSVSFVLLSIFGLIACPASTQETGRGVPGGQQASGFELQQNYPNPFNPETTIPFTLYEDLFADGRPVVVSIQIFNLLQQPVAVPVALNHPAGEIRVRRLEYTSPGDHEAFWDGRDRSGSQVASGMYFVRLTVNGRSKYKRMLVTK